MSTRLPHTSLEKLDERFAPEEIVFMLRDTYNMAVDKKDWKGMYAIVSLVLAYSIGKPVQRSLSAQIDPQEIKRMFSPDPIQDDEDAIDVE